MAIGSLPWSQPYAARRPAFRLWAASRLEAAGWDAAPTLWISVGAPSPAAGVSREPGRGRKQGGSSCLYKRCLVASAVPVAGDGTLRLGCSEVERTAKT